MKALIPTQRLQQDSVHIWVLDTSNLVVADLPIALLAADEQKRLAFFHYEADRVRFAVGRMALRTLCSSYLSVNELDIKYDLNEYGKPFMPGSALQFNLSHSGDRVALAFCWEDLIGIDVEEMLPQKDFLQVASRFFSPSERAALHNLEGEEQRLSFYRCWTRKEAFVKALGLGVSAPLDRFSVEFRSDLPARMLEMDGTLGTREEWLLQDVSLSGNYASAIACKAQTKEVICYTRTMTSLISSLI